jgi:hypothetical protein
VRSVIGRCTVAALSRRAGGQLPTEALIGHSALGTLLSELGLPSTPSRGTTTPPTHYEGGHFSVKAHSSAYNDSMVPSPCRMIRTSD